MSHMVRDYPSSPDGQEVGDGSKAHLAGGGTEASANATAARCVRMSAAEWRRGRPTVARAGSPSGSGRAAGFDMAPVGRRRVPTPRRTVRVEHAHRADGPATPLMQRGPAGAATPAGPRSEPRVLREEQMVHVHDDRSAGRVGVASVSRDVVGVVLRPAGGWGRSGRVRRAARSAQVARAPGEAGMPGVPVPPSVPGVGAEAAGPSAVGCAGRPDRPGTPGSVAGEDPTGGRVLSVGLVGATADCAHVVRLLARSVVVVHVSAPRPSAVAGSVRQVATVLVGGPTDGPASDVSGAGVA
jgi:hypothetical protein